MRAILIDPLARSVTEVQIEESDTLRSLYKIMSCQTVACVKAGEVLDLWVDDDGRHVQGNGAFKIWLGELRHHTDFAGPAVLVNNKPTKEGIEMSPLIPQLTVEKVTACIRWMSKPQPPRMEVVAFDGESCGGTWDGFSVGSDADPGL